VTFKDGTKQSDVMTLAEINAVRKRSRAGGEGPWVTDYAEMAKKTVFRRLSKWLTLSPEVADALDKVEPTIAPQVLVETVSQSVAAAESEALDVPSVAQVTDSEPDDVPGAEAPTPKAAPKAAAPAAPVPVTLAADTIQRTVQQHLAEVVENAGFTFGDFVKWAGESGNIQDADSLTGWPEVDPTVARRLIRAEKGLIAGIKQAKGVAQ
jgi:recombination protein RecT